MKSLIVPSKFTTNIHKRHIYKSKNIFKSIVKFNFNNISSILKDHLLSTESYFYSHFPEILGQENVYILGEPYKEYNKKFVDEFSRYPSLNKNKINNFLKKNEALDILNHIDFILIGSRSGEIGNFFIKSAKKKDIPVIIIDYFDDKEVYLNTKNIHRGFNYGKDFDLFFKHDIPLHYNDSFTFPLAPMPVDPNSYLSFYNKSNDKKYDIFYRGRSNHSPRDDRTFLCNYLKNNFINSKIEEIDSYEKISIKDYCKNFSLSKIAFSPSGKVWDSTRHTETAIYGNIPMIPLPDCQLTSDDMIDEEKAILYDPCKLLLDNKNYLFNLKERINYILNDELMFNHIAQNWKNYVLQNHTLLKKSEYMIRKIQKII